MTDGPGGVSGGGRGYDERERVIRRSRHCVREAPTDIVPWAFYLLLA